MGLQSRLKMGFVKMLQRFSFVVGYHIKFVAGSDELWKRRGAFLD